MKFNLVFFMNLAVIASIGSPSPNSLLTRVPHGLCPTLVDRLGKFKNCELPHILNATLSEQAQPYICLLAVNSVMEICRKNSSRSWSNFEARYTAHVNTSICPFNYATNTSYLKIDVNSPADYFRSELKCRAVCEYNLQTLDDCVVMALLNEEMKLYPKGEADVKESHLQDQTRNTTQPIILDRQEAGNTHDPAHHNETITKEVKTTETNSECVTKDKAGKTNNMQFNAQTQPKINENHKGVNSSNTLHSSFINTSEKGVSNKVNANQDSNNNNNKFNNNSNSVIDDNIYKNNSHYKKGIKEDKILMETEMPLFKEDNDGNQFNPSTGRKDYTYGTTIKASADEGEEDDNEEMPESHPLHDVLSEREYEPEKVPNPKELYNGDGLFQAEDSHFSAYFLTTISIIIIGYVVYHNKNKIVAYALEGRRGRNGRRRPTSAAYRKLDCNLEEVIASNPSHASITNVVY